MKYNIIFIAVFSLILFSLGISSLFNNNQSIIDKEKRNPNEFIEFDGRNVLKGDWQDMVELTMLDKFILRDNMISYQISMESQLSMLTSKIISIVRSNPDKQLVKTILVNKGRYNAGDNEMMILSPNVYSEEYLLSINENVNEINYLDSIYKNVEFFVYLPLLANDIDTYDIETATSIYLSQFNNLNVKFDVMKINDFNFAKDIFYRTDHHWNHLGSKLGYEDIIRLLFDGKVKPQIPTQLECFKGINFYGSHQRAVSYSSTVLPDNLCHYDYQLDNFVHKIDGEFRTEYGNLSKYREETVTNEIGFDHYNYLHQARVGEIIFDFNNSNADNILIISDSMSNSIRDVLASHFNKSIFINLDMYDRSYGTFDIDDYIKEYDIDKVLIMTALANYDENREMSKLIAE